MRQEIVLRAYVVPKKYITRKFTKSVEFLVKSKYEGQMPTTKSNFSALILT